MWKNSRLKQDKSKEEAGYSNIPLEKSAIKNVEHVKEKLGSSADLIDRFIKHNENKYAFAVVHIDGISSTKIIQEHILEPLLTYKSTLDAVSLKDELEQTISISKIKEKTTLKDVLTAIVTGSTVILIDGDSTALVLDTKEIESRSVAEPTTQTVIRGPKDSFTENLRTNTALVRGRIQSPNLRLDSMIIGDVTQTSVEIMYIKDIANDSIVKEVKQRIKRIKIAGILESSYIENYIRDDRHSPFPTVQNTERPDVVAGNLLEGRVAVFIGGTPYVLIVPVTFTQLFQSSEDYYQNQYIGSFLRLLRLGAFLLALYAPAVYIAMITHHQALVPTVLLVSIAAQREAIPFPAIIEAFIMEITFEVLREAGIRMPRAVGSALSIVGALILGQAAVEAGFVSAAMVIIVSVTAIASFALPNYNLGITARILRFLLLVVASYAGLYGVLAASLIIGMHMCGLSSFGVPYLYPVAPFRLKEQKDVLFRFSIEHIVNRPSKAKGRKNIRMRYKK
ncbi:spore germination protein [Bacillus sp. AFS076308]|uniref:spore germination protein n=1 Tax=unclassified Bacillus (in: firmicutes) TaxID=185979 RepID=UPI000BF2A3A7|nr:MULTISPECIES: spore germination protein [unclassified Bacillus (in: firmicutes)]PFN77025.1 spore germination protein [Bacillus sp. AFS076308]PGV49115.1 spore germination protein [Bacillus sp. AFS037270]